MKPLTAEEIRRIVGSVGDKTAADILATDPRQGELLEAVAWVHADDAMMDELRPLPSGRVGTLVEILKPVRAPED